MKTNLRDCLMCILLFVTGCSSQKNTISNWQEKPLTATGNEKDWNEMKQYDSKSKLWYYLSNDDKNLYVMLKADDEGLKRKIFMFGLTVWIDTTGHQKEKLGIRYPKQRERDMNPGQNFRERSSGTGERKPEQVGQRFLEQQQVIELIGFNHRESDVMMLGESKIKPVISFDAYNAFVYQCVIPLNLLSRSFPSGKPISLGFITGNIEEHNTGEGREEGMRSGRYGGEGMGNGGGMRGGGMGGRPGGMGGRSEGMRGDMDMSAPSKLWIKNYCLKCATK